MVDISFSIPSWLVGVIFGLLLAEIVLKIAKIWLKFKSKKLDAEIKQKEG